jgi:hypothetical protein
MGGAPKIQPTPIPTPPQLPNNKSKGFSDFAAARTNAGFAGTIMTSGSGLTGQTNVGRKTLLGD